MSRSSEDMKKQKERIVADAMRQVEQAMRQVKIATKGSHRFTAEQGSNPDKDGGIVINSGGLFGGKGARINIQSAQNVQIGNNNMMVVNQSRKSKPSKSRRKRYESSSSSDEDSPTCQEPTATAASTPDQNLITNSERLVNDKDVRVASNFMGKSWRRIGRYLQLSDVDLEQIYTEYFREGGIMEVGYQVLLKWRRKSAQQATIGVLTSVLCKVHSPKDVLKCFEP